MYPVHMHYSFIPEPRPTQDWIKITYVFTCQEHDNYYFVDVSMLRPVEFKYIFVQFLMEKLKLRM